MDKANILFNYSTISRRNIILYNIRFLSKFSGIENRIVEEIAIVFISE